MERLRTGIDGLDLALKGGLPKYSSTLIAGPPGTGKTILTQNIMFNIAGQHKAIYVTTLSEPSIKVIRYQKEFSFFNRDYFMENVIYQDIGGLIRKEGARQALDFINRLVMEHRPGLVAIDSIKAVADILISNREFREFVSDLSVKVAVWDCTVLLVGEYTEAQITAKPEAAVVDGIIYLYGTEEKKHQKRFIRIMKMRGTDFATGEHLMKITRDGIKVYPRLNPVLSGQFYPQPGDCRQTTGVPGLDGMLGGGLPSGSTTLITGGTGTGKTILSLSWLVRGAMENEPGIFCTYEENPDQLVRTASSFGWDLRGLIDQRLLKVLHVSPVELDLDEHIHEIQSAAREMKAKRIVIDSITAFELGMNDKHKYTDYVWGVCDYFKTQGISIMLVNESEDLFGLTQIARHKVSYISDNIIALGFFMEGINMRRAVGVLKMRGSAHAMGMRELVMGSGGPAVLDRPVEK